MTRLKRIAAAFGEDAPNLHELANDALRDIDVAKGELTAEAQAIRGLMAMAPKPRPAPAPAPEAASDVPSGFTPWDSTPSPIVAAPATSEFGATAGLTDGEKDRIAEIWIAARTAHGANLQAADITATLKDEGYPLNVEYPGMAIGTVLRRVRREYENGQEKIEGIA